MIATHSIKALNSIYKQPALRAKILGITPAGFLSSQNIPHAYYAAPYNAANLGVFATQAKEANDLKHMFDDEIPDIEDGRIKQILLPLEESYIAATPTPSLAMLDVLYSEDLRLYHYHRIQKNPIARSNHGFPIAKNFGSVKLIKNIIGREDKSVTLNDDFVLLTAECHNMNISSCYVSAGIPALTGIGGAVHSIERAVNESLPFAFGIKKTGLWQESVLDKSSKPAVKTGEFQKRVVSDEITSNCQIAVAIKAVNKSAVVDALKKLNRLCGGSLFNVEVSITNIAPNLKWIKKTMQFDNMNFFDALVIAQEKEEKSYLNYCVVQSGYALLETPKIREMSRSENKKHAWVEPIHKIYGIGGLSTHDFFTLKYENNVFFWS